ncbi:MAG TPA: PorV/PorQ family protein, partial [Parasegetibacter sp.]
GIGYTKIFDEANKINFALDINKLMVPTPPVFPTTAAPTAEDSAKLADYRSKSVPSSWLSSFGDAPGGFGEELKELQFSLGAEYWYNDQFAFRVGYFFEDKTKGNRKYFTVGAGIKYNVINLNFSYLVPSGSGISRNPLSNTLRFGISFDLNSDY